MVNSSREQLLQMLEQHEAGDEREQAALDVIVEFVRTHENPYSRDNLDAHVTASGIMLHKSERRTLLVWHTKLQRWLQPGGHVEADDVSAYESARRECVEETGHQALDHPWGNRILDVDVHPIPARRDQPAHNHLDIRFLFVAGEESGPADHELRWAHETEIPSLNLDPAAVRALNKAFSLQT